MKCVICQSTDIEQQDVDEEIRHGSDIYILELNVPVCNQCGERYYSRNDIRMLEKYRTLIEEGEVTGTKSGEIRTVEPA